MAKYYTRAGNFYYGKQARNFRYIILAQDKSRDVGKLVSINLDTNEKKIISMGHRNPQGLYYHSNLNYLFSTEHGPNGGDEINLLNLNKKYC